MREILPDETIVDDHGHRLRRRRPDGSERSRRRPGADPLTVDLNHPTDIQEFPNGDLLVMCWHNHKIRVIDKSDGRVRVLLGAGAGFAGDGGPATAALVNQPPHGVLDPNGNLFLIDQRNQRIRVIYNFATERENAIIDTVVGTGTAGFNGDGAGAADPGELPGRRQPRAGERHRRSAPDGALYFSDTNNNRIRKVVFSDPGTFKNGVVTTIAGTGDKGFGGDGGPAVDAQLSYPEDIEIGPDGNLYFADTDNNRVRMIDLTTGVITTVAGTGENGYGGDGGQAAGGEAQPPVRRRLRPERRPVHLRHLQQPHPQGEALSRPTVLAPRDRAAGRPVDASRDLCSQAARSPRMPIRFDTADRTRMLPDAVLASLACLAAARRCCSPRRRAPSVPGDCNGSGTVDVSELDPRRQHRARQPAGRPVPGVRHQRRRHRWR